MRQTVKRGDCPGPSGPRGSKGRHSLLRAIAATAAERGLPCSFAPVASDVSASSTFATLEPETEAQAQMALRRGEELEIHGIGKTPEEVVLDLSVVLVG